MYAPSGYQTQVSLYTLGRSSNRYTISDHNAGKSGNVNVAVWWLVRLGSAWGLLGPIQLFIRVKCNAITAKYYTVVYFTPIQGSNIELKHTTAFHLHFTCISLAFHSHFTCISLAFHLHSICIPLAFHLHFTCISLARAPKTDVLTKMSAISYFSF